MRAWLIAVAALLVLLLVGTAPSAAPPSATAPTGLSTLGAPVTGPVQRDPVQALAVDITEHLPDTAQRVGSPPLPLHAPAPVPDSLALDELQGLEWAALQPVADPSPPVSRQRPVSHGDRFASTDHRRHERPPTDPDHPRR